MELVWVRKASIHFAVDDAEQSSLRYLAASVLPVGDEQSNAWLCFLTPSEAWNKKYLYCSQVWQCSIIKTILIESSLPRITEDPWTDSHTHAPRTSGLYHISLVAFPELWATSTAQKPQKSSSSVLARCHLVNLPSPKQKLPNGWKGLIKLTPDASPTQVSQDRLMGSLSHKLLQMEAPSACDTKVQLMVQKGVPKSQIAFL